MGWGSPTQRHFTDVTPGTADQLKVCARQYTIVNSLVSFSLIPGEDTVRKGPGEFVICPNGFETAFVEDSVSFADTKVVPVFWEVRKLLWQVERRWKCGARRIEGDRCRRGALKCNSFLRFVRARSGVSPDWEV